MAKYTDLDLIELGNTHDLSPKERRNVKRLLARTLDPENFSSVRNWVSQCYNRPSQTALIMCALNQVLRTHGVEAIRIEGEYVDSYHHDIVGTYCNTGDTYALTIVHDSRQGEFLITSWGDFYETCERENSDA